ncbi:RNase adapter RapZ [Lapillicoccus sp.]|uniref:RNase adapter RapZ n=1 Tax=Lapillicoccus sp. TaxID=1909287 RepID=UPI0027C6E183|nr:RNase adapter RapZ [Actinomycetota bacterium]
MTDKVPPAAIRSARASPGADEPMLVLTGMSGAGRSTMANVLEDLGWFVVDNLPPQMLPQLLELHEEYLDRTPDPLIRRVAAVVDVRSHGVFADFEQIVAELGSVGHRPSVVFLDATDEALVRRFESVRRPHPLQADGRLLDGIQRERLLLGELRSEADVILDTSGLNVHQLAAKAMSLFAGDGAAQVRLAVMSFGFKYGVPLDADFVLDLRFLPNPFWVPELRPLTGRDAVVSEFVLAQPGATEFVDDVVRLLGPVLNGFVRENRRYVTMALGCTGGKHRSVAIAEQLAVRLADGRVDTFLVHRDLGRE